MKVIKAIESFRMYFITFVKIYIIDKCLKYWVKMKIKLLDCIVDQIVMSLK